MKKLQLFHFLIIQNKFLDFDTIFFFLVLNIIKERF